MKPLSRKKSILFVRFGKNSERLYSLYALMEKATQAYYCVNRRCMEELKEKRIIYDLFNARMKVEL